MNQQEIYDLIARFDASGLQTLKLSQGDFCIEMEKPTPEAPAPAAVPVFAPAAVPAAVPAVPAAAPSAQTAPAQAEEKGMTIDAPLVGTFYAAPSPDQPPFVTEGTQVKKGQTVCLLEAMKTMIEVPAPCDCVIGEILKANGELAAFGEALMRYEPC